MSDEIQWCSEHGTATNSKCDVCQEVARSSRARGSVIRPSAARLINEITKALSGEPEISQLTAIIDRHHRLAADAREMIHNNGFGPNISQLRRIDAILREIAGLPPSPND